MPKLNVDLVVDDQGSIVIKKFAGTVKDVFSALGPAMLALGGGAGVVEILSQSVKSASDLAEVTSKFNTVFAGQTALAETWAQTMVDGYAMSTRESRQYLAAMQDLLVPMGMNADAAGKMSNEVVKLAADLGSFNNKETATVMDDIQSALVGNYETMKKYGVVLNASVVEQEALRMGLKKTKDELTAADKAQSAYALIVKGSQAAIGDMGRTQDGYANQLKKAKATVEDITAAIGEGLQPELADLLKWFNDSGPEIVMEVKMWAGTLTEVAVASKEILGIMLELTALPSVNRGINLISGADEFHAQAMAQIAAYKQIALLQKSIEEKQAAKDNPAAKTQAAIDAEIRRAAEIIKINGQLNLDLEKLTLSLVDQKRAALGREMADLLQNFGQEVAVRDTLAQVKLLKELDLNRELVESDKKALTSRLDEYKKYSADIANQIKETVEAERKALKDISDLHVQAMNTRRSTEGMLGDLGGKTRSDKDQYSTTRGELAQIWQDAQLLTGQEKITALETFKKAVHDLALEFKGGAGNATGASIFAAARTDIQAAYDLQKQTMAELTTAAEQQVAKSKIWGAELYSAAAQANNAIVYLQETLDGLQAQLNAMDTFVAISAQDNATETFDAIQRAVDGLHGKTIEIITNHIDTYSGGGTQSFQVFGSHALGTGFIPRTGPYELHYGESVNTAAETRALSAGGGSFNLAGGGSAGGNFVVEGDMHFHLPEPRPGASLPTGSELDRWVRDQAAPAFRRARLVQ